ncbi:MAG: hypothetical protein VYC40_02225 [Pseudomonadota bacterium]|nr:hypothetical protein [Pseudomonadota bacterium]
MKIFYFALLALLTACSEVSDVPPYQMGVEQKSWQALSSSEKSRIRSGYQKSRALRARMRERFMQPGQFLYIKVQGGTASMGENYTREAFKEVAVNVYPGDVCHSLLLKSTINPMRTIPLSVCLDDRFVYFDASSSDPDYYRGSFMVPLNTFLKQGLRFCELQTKGVAQLQQSCLQLKLVDKDGASAYHKMAWKLHHAKPSTRYLQHMEIEDLKNK